MDKSANGIFSKFYNMPRFAPSIFSAFLFLVLLLFYGELSYEVQHYLIPSLLAYAIGAALLGFIHRLMGLNYEGDINQKNTTEKISEGNKTITTVCIRVFNNEKTIPWAWKLFIYLLHLIWFAIFTIYNVHRGVI